MPGPSFEIVARDPSGRPRAGVLHTAHGTVLTPAFAPVGTQGVVKALSPRQVAAAGVDVVMTNAYHLTMRPGVATIQALGGLHRFAAWDGPLMTDSGGFQVFSLAPRRRLDPDGVTFQSHLDGATHRFTPESVIAAHDALGGDLVMPLDVCSAAGAPPCQAAEEMRLTLRWAERSRAAHVRSDQLLYGIVQGATFADLRRESARRLADLGFQAFAIGGVSVGESKDEMLAAVDATVAALPEAAPRHLLGVGQPEDIVAGIARGVDTFDCVVPTRWARHGTALTWCGRLNLRNARFVADPAPLMDGCTCYACQHFSRAAIRHLVMSGEILGLSLLTLHNLHCLVNLTREARAAILDGTFARFAARFLATYAPARPARRPTVTAATDATIPDGTE